ncbi:carbohydrate-binding domain-containing protein, partial [bacterium]|nr:carbohydrate-binding domain-containing protein [bacterium]
MRGKWTQFLGAWVFVLCLFIACGGGSDPVSASGGDDSGGAGSGSGSSKTVPDAESDNGVSHDDAADYTWDGEKAVQIVLNGGSASVSAAGATAQGGTVTVNSAGTYVLSGTLSDGQVVVNTEETGMVRLILDGVDITSSSSAPIYIKKADKAMLVLADNTTNKLKDGSSYVYDDAAEEEPNAAVFSKSDLTVYGNGALTVEARFDDGITSKDGLVIASGTLTVSAKDDGIRGKDYLIVKDGRITVSASGDGLKSDNEKDASLGYVLIENGTLTVTAGGDALSAQTDALIRNGELTLTADEIRYNDQAHQATAHGHLVLTRGAVRLIADEGTYALDTGKVRLTNTRAGYYPLYLQGRELEGNIQEFTLKDATVTYGEPTSFSPQLRANALDFTEGKSFRA